MPRILVCEAQPCALGREDWKTAPEQKDYPFIHMVGRKIPKRERHLHLFHFNTSNLSNTWMRCQNSKVLSCPVLWGSLTHLAGRCEKKMTYGVIQKDSSVNQTHTFKLLHNMLSGKDTFNIKCTRTT